MFESCIVHCFVPEPLACKGFLRFLACVEFAQLVRPLHSALEVSPVDETVSRGTAAQPISKGDFLFGQRLWSCRNLLHSGERAGSQHCC